MQNGEKTYADFIWRTENDDAHAIRKEIEVWLSNVEDTVARHGIETYLKREDNQQVRGAYFELYLHECLIHNGFKIEFHPVQIQNHMLTLWMRSLLERAI